MHSKYAIFMVSAVLLVPFVYATSSLPYVCAVPASGDYVTSKDCSGTLEGEGIRTCCWEKDGAIQCQSCQRSTDKDGDPVLFCGPVVFPGSLRPGLSGTLDEGQVIEGNTTGPGLTQDGLPGGVFKVPERNQTLTQSDNNSNNTLAELESDIEGNTDEESTGEEDAGKEQDGSEEEE